jgi:hypothetical protein
MKVKLSMVVAGCLGLLLSGCTPTPQSLIVGKWEAETAVKMTAEFNTDGSAKLTILGHTVQGTYKLNEGELEWTVNGITTKSKVVVTTTELEVTDKANRTIKYKRK